jgi:hypothetical protein
MQLRADPGGITRLMTAITVGRPNKRLIRYVVGGPPVCRWVCTAVASCTLAHNCRLGVIELGRFPTRHGVAAQAVGRGRDVRGGLARGAHAVAAGAVGRGSKAAVINLGTRPAVGVVTGLARVSRYRVHRGLAVAGGALVT